MQPHKQPALHVSIAVVDGERLLLVQESKPSCAGKWNLPGGHIELGESPIEAASRELAEETSVAAVPESLVGTYTGPSAIRFVFLARYRAQPVSPGSDILDARFVALHEIEAWPDEHLVGPNMLRLILNDLKLGRQFSLESFIREHPPIT